MKSSFPNAKKAPIQKLCLHFQCQAQRSCFGKKALSKYVNAYIYICIYIYTYTKSSFPKHYLQTWLGHCKPFFCLFWNGAYRVLEKISS